MHFSPVSLATLLHWVLCIYVVPVHVSNGNVVNTERNRRTRYFYATAANIIGFFLAWPLCRGEFFVLLPFGTFSIELRGKCGNGPKHEMRTEPAVMDVKMHHMRSLESNEASASLCRIWFIVRRKCYYLSAFSRSASSLAPVNYAW